MLVINPDFEKAVNAMVLSNELKESINDEEAELIKALLLNFYGINVEGL